MDKNQVYVVIKGEKYLTVKQIEDYVGIKYAAAMKLGRDAGAEIKIGKHCYFSVSKIDKYLEKITRPNTESEESKTKAPVCSYCTPRTNFVAHTQLYHKSIDLGDVGVGSSDLDICPYGIGERIKSPLIHWRVDLKCSNPRPFSFYTKINFCPMCGRKLIKDGENDGNSNNAPVAGKEVTK